MAVYVTREESFPNIDWCTSYAANCVHSRCFVLFITTFIFLLCVSSCRHLFIHDKLISSYFSSGMAQPLSAIRVAVLSFFHSDFLLMSLQFLYQEHNKDCCCCCCCCCYGFGNEKDRWSW